MKYPINASIVLIQLKADSEAVAYVAYGEEGDVTQKEVRYRLGTMPDAIDLQMWMQMAAARVCDAL